MLHKSARNSAYRGCKSEPLCPLHVFNYIAYQRSMITRSAAADLGIGAGYPKWATGWSC